MYNLLIGYLEPSDAVWQKLHKNSESFDKDFHEIQAVVRIIIKNAAHETAVFPDLTWWHRNQGRRHFESQNVSQGLLGVNEKRGIINQELN